MYMILTRRFFKFQSFLSYVDLIPARVSCQAIKIRVSVIFFFPPHVTLCPMRTTFFPFHGLLSQLMFGVSSILSVALLPLCVLVAASHIPAATTAPCVLLIYLPVSIRSDGPRGECVGDEVVRWTRGSCGKG